MSLLGQLAQLTLAADSGVLRALMEGVIQASFSKPPPSTSHQLPSAVHHNKEHQAAASLLHGLLAFPVCLCAASEVNDFNSEDLGWVSVADPEARG